MDEPVNIDATPEEALKALLRASMADEQLDQDDDQN